jgi:hypothetical protein
MGLEYDHGCGCFKSNTPLDADDGVAYMDVSSNAKRAGQRLQILNGFGRVLKIVIVNPHQLQWIYAWA